MIDVTLPYRIGSAAFPWSVATSTTTGTTNEQSAKLREAKRCIRILEMEKETLRRGGGKPVARRTSGQLGEMI
jgi:hypothetical protein